MPTNRNSSFDREGFELPLYQVEDENKDLVSGFDSSRLLLVTSKSLVWIFLLLAGAVFGSWLYLRYTKPLYQSSSVLKLESKNNALMLGLDKSEEAQANNNISTLSGEIEIIRSRLVFEKTLKRLHLETSCFAQGKILDEEKYAHAPVKVSYKISDPAFYDKRIDLRLVSTKEYEVSYELSNKEKVAGKALFGKSVHFPGFSLTIQKTSFYTPELNDQAFFLIINSKEHLYNYLEKSLVVEILNPQANTLKLTFTDVNAQKAKDIIETIDKVYLEQTIENKSKAQQQTLQFLEESLQNTEAKLATAEYRLEAFMKKNKTVDVKNDVTRVIKEIEELDKTKSALQIKVSLLNNLKDLMVSGKNVKTIVPSFPELADPVLSKLITQLITLQQEKQLKLTRNNENTYVITSINTAIENLKKNILSTVTQNRKLLYQELEEIEKQEDEQKKAFLSLPGKETKFTRIKRFYDLYEKYYLLLMEKKAEYGIAKAGMVPNFMILSSATVSKTPISPNMLLAYLTGLGFGFLLSIGLIIIRYTINNSVTSQKELEKLIHSPILGGIPEYLKEKMKISKIIVEKSPKAAICEALRTIRTNLEFINTSKEKKIISITSTISGEGKTFVAVNLAGIIAMSNQKVVFIDLDMRKPKGHKAFDRVNNEGMSSLLINKVTLSDVLQKTEMENLDFISAGPNPPNPSELLMRPEMQVILKELQAIYDVIIIDTPPVGLVTDAVLIMKYATIPLYIVRANYSKKTVSTTINKLAESRAFTGLSVILNAMRSINSYGYGNYGYGYGNKHGYYEEEDKDSSIITRIKNFLGA